VNNILRLVPRTRDEVQSNLELLDPATRAQISADWLAKLHASAHRHPWVHGFNLLLDDDTNIGLGGFKGPPVDGFVEIAYAIVPQYQGRGHATATARALVEHAFDSPDVRLVRAHTLPGGAASQRVLLKAGFARAGEHIDADDGLVWRFEIARNRRVYLLPLEGGGLDGGGSAGCASAGGGLAEALSAGAAGEPGAEASPAGTARRSGRVRRAGGILRRGRVVRGVALIACHQQRSGGTQGNQYFRVHECSVGNGDRHSHPTRRRAHDKSAWQYRVVGKCRVFLPDLQGGVRKRPSIVQSLQFPVTVFWV